MKRFSILFTYFFLSSLTTLLAQPPAAPFYSDCPPKCEMRAVWLTTLASLDWPHSSSPTQQQKELRLILDSLQHAGINTVLLQTRLRATTIYPSAIEPWDKVFTGYQSTTPPAYDPLAFAITECHQRGLQLHAWVVAIPVGKWNERGCSTLRRKYPKLLKHIGEEGYLDPENPQTADYIASICEEITRRYDIDGIHLDYIRYPETWHLRTSPSQARANITRIVSRVHSRVKSIKPWVTLSCSPIGKYSDLPRQSSIGWNAYSRVYQEAQAWLQQGLMDCLFPMMYFRDKHFFPFILDWHEHSYGRIIAPGLGIYFLSPREKNWTLPIITTQLENLRSLHLGHAFFRSQFFTNNTKGIYSFTSSIFDRTLALTPPLTWLHSTPPSPPTTLRVDSLHHTLSWSGATDHSDAPYLTYNIYASRSFPVDTSDPHHLVRIRQQSSSSFVPLSGEYYAVTAMDRYGNESQPIQQKNVSPLAPTPTLSHSETPTLYFCHDNSLTLDLSLLNPSDLIQITTPPGRVMKTFLVSSLLHQPSATIHLSDLPNGFYVVRTLGRKNISHRLAYIYLSTSHSSIVLVSEEKFTPIFTMGSPSSENGAT